MGTLVQFQSDDRSFQLMQNSWAAQLNPLLTNPSLHSNILSNIKLLAASNPNVVNHKLGRKLQGYRVILKNAQSDVWDLQSTNKTPDLTLNLKVSADVTVSLEVF